MTCRSRGRLRPVLRIAGVLALALLSASPAHALSGRTLLTLTGESSSNSLGTSVAGAGDVNGDGFPDLIVGAPNAGRAYVYLGGPSGDAVADLTLVGASSDIYGLSVASAGDVNGDGYGDVIVGAPGNDITGVNAGAIYVYFGGHFPDATADLILTGTTGEQFGTSVASAGDVNGDGFDDLIVGAPFNGLGGSNSGRAIVFFGGASMNGVADLFMNGLGGDLLGFSVASAGDVNGDGYGDLIIGAYGAGGSDAGQAYLYYGGAVPNDVIDLTMNGATANDSFGKSVSSAGDVNGDGFGDLIVGAPGNDAGGTDAGRAYVFYGSPSTDATADVVLTGATAFDSFGGSVASAGDVNGDGFDDVIAGAPLNDIGGNNAGRAYVFHGAPLADAVVDLTVTGALAGDLFGGSVAPAGDMNADGFDDFIVGANENDAGGTNAGRAYVMTARPYEIVSPNGREQWVVGEPATIRWLGRDLADLAITFDGGATWSPLATGVGGNEDNTFDLATPGPATATARIQVSPSGAPVTYANSDQSDAMFRIVMPSTPPATAHWLRLTVHGAAGERLGSSVASIGDFNGDGFPDLIAGAYLSDEGGTDAGRAYIYDGGVPADPTPRLVLTGTAPGDQFGWTSAAAGDVNGDGFADVIVGARYNDEGGTDAGQAYVYYGGPFANSDPDLVLTGNAAGDHFGWSVASAGDVNRDGFADVIVGAPHSDAGGTDSGEASIFFGGPSPDATADLVLTRPVVGGYFGWSVASAGDFNDDGFGDVIVGAWGNDFNGTDSGRAYVYYGGAVPNGGADLAMEGEAAGDSFGESVASAGDVNGDGFPDLIVGAGGNDAGGDAAGRAYVFHGGPAGDDAADLVLTGVETGLFGHSVAGAGDVNGDSFADLIVGAYLNSAGGIAAGRAFIYYGGTAADARADAILTGAAAGDDFGWCVAAAMDANGDGFDDVVVGGLGSDTGGADAGQLTVFGFNRYHVESPNRGETWNAGTLQSISWLGSERADLWLSTDGGATYDLLRHDMGGRESNTISVLAPDVPTTSARVKVTPVDPTMRGADESDGLFRIVQATPATAAAHRLRLAPTGTAAGDRLGWSVAPAGDFNGDGLPDFIVGAYRNDAGGVDAGRAYVYFGGLAADATADLVLTGAGAGDNFGWSVAGAGDMNGDGFADVIVGARFSDANGADAGRAYVYFGGPAADAAPDLVLTGDAADDRFGWSVAAAGDVNGDGYADVIVGAPNNDAGAADAGQASIYFGGPSPNNTADVVLTRPVVAGYFGSSVASTGDINGDGYGDLIVGAWGNDFNGTDSGRAYIYYGGLVPDDAADLVMAGEAAFDNFGDSVAPAGDVNGDGFPDFMVGAPGNDAGGDSAGRVYVFHGGPYGDDVADLVLTGVDTGLFGHTAAGAGDVNGDGFADLIVGAYLNSVAGLSAGRAYVYFGGASGDTTADVVLTGGAALDDFGLSVASAGDLNGDSFPDVIVGGPLNDAGGADAGRAYVYEFNRYLMLAPNDDEVWNVGGSQTVSWLGAERADLWLSTNGGASYDMLRHDVGGSTSNGITLLVPHAPTKFARVKVTPVDASVRGGDESDSTFTIQSSVALLSLIATLGEDGAELSWSSEPGVGPEGLAGYRLYRLDAGGASANGTRIGPELITATRYADGGGAPGSVYRLTALNGLGEELELGRVSLAPAAPIAAWPLPYRGGSLNVTFALYGIVGAGGGTAEIELYDVSGRLVRRLARGAFNTPQPMLTWDGRDDHGNAVGTGLYFLRVTSAGMHHQLKVAVIR